MDLTGIPFTKVYRSMLTSSLWTMPHPRLHMVRCVWMTLMLLADRRGYVHASVPGLAAAAIVTLEEAEEALQLFREPDRYSRTREHEGRRLVDVEGGWLLLNYESHRAAAVDELAKQSKREWYHREKAKRSSAPSKTRCDSLAPSKLEEIERVPSASSSDQDRSLEGPEQNGSTGSAQPVELQGLRGVHRSLTGWEPRPELFARAVEIGLPREVVEARIAELRNGPIGGARGVFDRDDYVMRQLPRWKTWHETAQSQAVHRAGSANGAGTGPRRGGILRSVLEPTGRHRAYAEKHGLDLAALTRKIEESGAVEELGHKRALELLGQTMSKAVHDKAGSG